MNDYENVFAFVTFKKESTTFELIEKQKLEPNY